MNLYLCTSELGLLPLLKKHTHKGIIIILQMKYAHKALLTIVLGFFKISDPYPNVPHHQAAAQSRARLNSPPD